MKATLGRRERVLRAIAHEEADRYPLDLGMHFSTGISVFAYHNLREYLGLDTSRIEAIDPVQLLARVDDDILERFHIDTKLLRPAWVNPVRWNIRGDYTFLYPNGPKRELLANGDWVISKEGQGGPGRMRLPVGGFFCDGDWLNIRDYEMDETLRVTGREAERIYKESDYFTCYMSFTGFFTGLDYACDMLTDPDGVRAHNQRLLDRELLHARKLIEHGKDYIGCVEINSDLGMQSGPMCNPELYGELVAPYLKQLCAFIHENSDYKLFLHCCGSVEPFLPYIIDAGIDILNPVQISAANMDPADLKRKYGGRICFWGGGCDTQNVLGRAAPEQVRANVKALTDTFKPGGGFVFNQVHNIMGNVPPENIVAMLDAAYENSFY